jgi:hypothetical protein
LFRVHCAVLKVRAAHGPETPQRPIRR